MIYIIHIPLHTQHEAATRHWSRLHFGFLLRQLVLPQLHLKVRPRTYPLKVELKMGQK